MNCFDRIIKHAAFCLAALLLSSSLWLSACTGKPSENEHGEAATDAISDNTAATEDFEVGKAEASQAEAESDVYIISFEQDGEPVTEEEKQLVFDTIAAADPDHEILYSYMNVFDGVAVKTTDEAAETVDELEYVNVYNSQKMAANSLEAAMFSVSELVNSAYLNDSGYRGEGMTVAVIDTSFDVDHELFVLSDESTAAFTREYIDAMVEKGLSSTKYFVDNPGTTPYISAKIPYAFDYYGDDIELSDINGHGTHVAGIIGANSLGSTGSESFDGIAPEAQLILMKVAVDDSMSIDDYALYAALDDAISLGVDVINMSFGVAAGASDRSSSSSRFYNLIEFAREHGICVFCAAGNDGSLGSGSRYDEEYGISYPTAENPDYGLISEPASFDASIAVASSENSFIHINRYIKSSSDDIIVFNESNRSNFAAELGGKEYEYAVIDGSGKSSDYNGTDVSGKIALVMRGTIEFSEKAKIAAELGAVGIIVWNNDRNETDLINMELSDVLLPAAFISYADGQKLIGCKNKTLEIVVSETAAFASESAGTISTFSSRGPTTQLTLKPDITAPGGNVWSTYNGNTYQSLSGTSMATPVASGAALVIKQYLESDDSGVSATVYNTEDDIVRKLMMSSAVPLIDPESGVEYSPRAQGAGLVNIGAAASSGIILTDAGGKAAKLELGDKLGTSFGIDVRVKNITGSDQKYLLSAALIGDNGEKNQSSGEYFIDGSSIAFSTARISLNGAASSVLNRHSGGFNGGYEITVPAEEELILRLNFSVSSSMFEKYADIFANGFYLEGFIYFEPLDGEWSAASIPFMGFYGDWNAVPIFDELDSDDAFFGCNIVSYIERSGDGLQYSLGTNVFIEDTEFSSDLIMISPDGDGHGEYIGIIINPLRNVANFNIRIYDSDGETVFSKLNMGSLTKAFHLSIGTLNSAYIHYIWNGTDSENAKYILPDGKYTFELTAMIKLSSAAIQTYSFDFYIDTVKPTADEVKLVENGDHKYIEVQAHDDRYLQAALLYAYGDADPDASAADAKNEVFNSIITLPVGKQVADKIFRFDITGYEDIEYFFLDIVDYAFNATTLRIDMSELDR